MNVQLVVASVLGAAGWLSAAVAIRSERRMHQQRLPGVKYSQATFRRDGGYKRLDLFKPEGLVHQAVAARYGVTAAALWVLALIAWFVLAV